MSLLGACGAAGNGSVAYDAQRSVPALTSAGWQAKSAVGMPQTVAGVHQAGYLDARAPDGAVVGLQFMDNTADASKELNAIRARKPNFAGTTIGNVLVGTSLPTVDLNSLRAHLQH